MLEICAIYKANNKQGFAYERKDSLSPVGDKMKTKLTFPFTV